MAGSQNQISDPNIGVAVKAPASVSTEDENVSPEGISASKKGGFLKFDFTAFRVRFSKRILPIILIGLGLGLITLIGVTTFLYIKESVVKISKVRITNISNGSATVSWVTDKESKGVVYYGEEDKWFPVFAFAGKQREDDDRDVEFNKEGDEILLEGGRKKYFTHHVTIEGLNPDTRYFFRVGTGVIRGFSKDSEGNKMKPIETGPVIESLSVPSPIYGRVFKQDNTSLTDGIVFVQLLDGVERRSTVISTIVENGTWTIDVTNARTLDLIDRVKIKEDTLFEEVRVEAGVEGFNTIVATPESDQPTTDIYLQSLESKDSAEGKNLSVLGLAQSLIFPASAQLACSEDYPEGCTCGNGSSGTKQCHKEGTSVDGQPGSGCSWGSGSSCTSCTCAGTGGGGDTGGTGGGTGSAADQCAGQYVCSDQYTCINKRWSENQQACVYGSVVDPCSCPAGSLCNVQSCGGTTGTPPGGQEDGEDTGGAVVAKVNCLLETKCCSGTAGSGCYCGTSYDPEYAPDTTGQCNAGTGTCVCKTMGAGSGTNGGGTTGGGSGPVIDETGNPGCNASGLHCSNYPIAGGAHCFTSSGGGVTVNMYCCEKGTVILDHQCVPEAYASTVEAGVDVTDLPQCSTGSCPGNVEGAQLCNLGGVPQYCCQEGTVYDPNSGKCTSEEAQSDYEYCLDHCCSDQSLCQGVGVYCESGTCVVRSSNSCPANAGSCYTHQLHSTDSCTSTSGTTVWCCPAGLSDDNGDGICGNSESESEEKGEIVCGDEVCTKPDENISNCPADCKAGVLGSSDDIYTIEVAESGNYSLVSSAVKLTNQEVDVFVPENGKGTIRFFADLNSNGTKDEGEEYIKENLGINLELTESETVYEMDKGWNLIGMSAFPTEVTGRTAKSLLETLNAQGAFITHIATYRDGSFLIFSQRGGIDFGNDFNIIPGEAYFVRAYTNVSIRLRGNRYLEAVPVQVNNGWNLMSIVKPDSSLTAQAVLDSMITQGITADALSQYESGLYTSIIKENGELFGRDFVVIDTRGYFIRVQEGGGKTWTP